MALSTAIRDAAVSGHRVGGRRSCWVEPLPLPPHSRSLSEPSNLHHGVRGAADPGAADPGTVSFPLSRGTCTPCRQPLRYHVTPREIHVPASRCVRCSPSLIPTRLPSCPDALFWSATPLSSSLALSLSPAPALPSHDPNPLLGLFRRWGGVLGSLCRPRGPLSAMGLASFTLLAGGRRIPAALS